MGLERYKFPDEDVTHLSDRILHLFQRALPDPSDRSLYERFMTEAHELGLSWLEGLEYVASKRGAGAQVAA